MKISAKGRYAVRIMVDIARNENDFVSISTIATRQGISIKYTEKIIACLLKKDMLKSMRGVNGGYKLTKQPKNYSIKEILEVTGDTPKLATCFEKECPHKNSCDTVGCWTTLTNLINDFLKNVTLQDLIDKTYK
ncbi:MAG: Rrf2 family transcriptional regulator [Clostridia bacterium]|nr:Rrf2 family transcriptional regulator [Clostridia bacterium]